MQARKLAAVILACGTSWALMIDEAAAIDGTPSGDAETTWTGAGVWRGSDSTTDGGFGYFIGHNPGSFWPVASIGIGDEVIVHDSNSASLAYRVVDTFVVPAGSTWGDVSGRVSDYGESIVMQTCVDSGYRFVIAV